MPPMQPPSTDQSTVSPSSYQLPPVPATPRKNPAGLIVLIVGIVLLLIAVGLYFFTPLGAYVKNLLVPTSIPQELQGASFLSNSVAGNTVVYAFPASGMTTTDTGLVIVSAARTPDGSAQITRSSDGLFKVSLDGTDVLHDKTPRVGIDRAPDGKSVVFAQASSSAIFVSPAMTGPTLTINRNNWNVVVYVPTTHTTIRLGTGVSPFFIDQTHVAWMAPAGLAVADLMTGKSKILVPDANGNTAQQTLVSPDHTIIAWYTTPSRVLTPYKVTATSAQALAQTTVPSARGIALGNNSFFELSSSDGTIDILKQPFGGNTSVVGHLPASLWVSRILLGNL